MNHGFLRTGDGTFTTFDVPGAAYTYPTGINSKGEITGWCETTNGPSRGFLRALDGTFTIFDPPGSTGTDPTGINSAGAITGVVIGRNGGLHGFVRIEDKREEDQQGDKN